MLMKRLTKEKSKRHETIVWRTMKSRDDIGILSPTCPNVADPQDTKLNFFWVNCRKADGKKKLNFCPGGRRGSQHRPTGTSSGLERQRRLRTGSARRGVRIRSSVDDCQLGKKILPTTTRLVEKTKLKESRRCFLPAGSENLKRGGSDDILFCFSCSTQRREVFKPPLHFFLSIKLPLKERAKFVVAQPRTAHVLGYTGLGIQRLMTTPFRRELEGET